MIKLNDGIGQKQQKIELCNTLHCVGYEYSFYDEAENKCECGSDPENIFREKWFNWVK